MLPYVPAFQNRAMKLYVAIEGVNPVVYLRHFDDLHHNSDACVMKPRLEAASWALDDTKALLCSLTNAGVVADPT